MTLRWVLAGAAAVAGAALAGPAQIELAVRIDPERRELHAPSMLVVDQTETEIALARQFDVTAVTIDGRPADPAGTVRDAQRVWRLPAAERARRVGIEWRGTLAALDPSIAHRQTLHQAEPVADPRGSFLPASTL